MVLSEEHKIELLKKAIKTDQGWKSLAESLKSYPHAKQECIELLKKIFINFPDKHQQVINTLENYLSK